MEQVIDPEYRTFSPLPNAEKASAGKRKENPQRIRMKENFIFFGPVTLLYAGFYAFCMFRNGSGITFPFFIAASFLYFGSSLKILGLTMKKGSLFYMVSMLLLAISTFCTDDARIIFFNKMGIFLLMMSLMLNQFYDTSGWKLGKYLGSIMKLLGSIGELGAPFSDAAAYFRGRKKKGSGKLGYAFLGLLIAIPLLAVVLFLLSGADAVFRQITDRIWMGINFDNIFSVLMETAFLYFAAYLLTAYLCRHTLDEQVADRRVGEPVVAITVTSLLTVVYMLFSGIQILYLFMGNMKLPEGYTYAEYAREGFFQLLAVSILNLVIVLATLHYFKESRVLKGILTLMSLCTFVMIASSALRMIIYIRFYYLTFLRILVLWGLVVLFLIFCGVILSIYREKFPLFGYSTVVVTGLYLILSFSHPDYLIAYVNISNTVGENRTNGFFLMENPHPDYGYLSRLSADAAPILIPYMAEIGYTFEWFDKEDAYSVVTQMTGYAAGSLKMNGSEEFGYRYLHRLQQSTENFGLRTYNVSRHMALRQIMQQNEKETGYE